MIRHSNIVPSIVKALEICLYLRRIVVLELAIANLVRENQEDVFCKITKTGTCMNTYIQVIIGTIFNSNCEIKEYFILLV